MLFSATEATFKTENGTILLIAPTKSDLAIMTKFDFCGVRAMSKFWLSRF